MTDPMMGSVGIGARSASVGGPGVLKVVMRCGTLDSREEPAAAEAAHLG